MPDMKLEEDGTHHRVTAASVFGLDFEERGEAVAVAAVAPSHVLAPPAAKEDSEFFADVYLAFAMVIATLMLAPVRVAVGYLAIFTMILGCMAAIKAKERLSTVAGPALILNVLAFVVWLSVHLVMSRS